MPLRLLSKIKKDKKVPYTFFFLSLLVVIAIAITLFVFGGKDNADEYNTTGHSPVWEFFLSFEEYLKGIENQEKGKFVYDNLIDSVKEINNASEQDLKNNSLYTIFIEAAQNNFQSVNSMSNDEIDSSVESFDGYSDERKSFWKRFFKDLKKAEIYTSGGYFSFINQLDPEYKKDHFDMIYLDYGEYLEG